MLSILKVQLLALPNNSCRPLHLSSSVTTRTVRLLLGLEAFKAPIYNGFIQRQPPWYLQIPLLPMNMMIMIQTELQVRDKSLSTFKIGTYKIPDNRRSRPVEMAASVHSTVSNSCTMAHDFMLILIRIPSIKTSRFDVDERESLSFTAPIKKNRFRSVCKKVKRWFKRA